MSMGGGEVDLVDDGSWLPNEEDCHPHPPDEVDDDSRKEESNGEDAVSAAGDDDMPWSPSLIGPGVPAVASGEAAAPKKASASKGGGRKEGGGNNAASKGRGPYDAAPRKDKGGKATPEVANATTWQVAKGRRRP